MSDSFEVPSYPSYTPPAVDQASLDATVEPSALDAGFVIVDPRFAVKLTTQHLRWFEVEALGKDSFTRDVPNVGEEALEGLDERGLVQVGTIIKPGSMLVGKISPREDTPLAPEEKLLRAIFGERAGDAVDRSLRAPPGCEGEVTAVTLEGSHARVQVSWTRLLEVGDVLTLDEHPAVVAELRDLEAELACQGVPSRVRVRKLTCARDVLHARAIGPYDLVTQQPLEGKERWGGQRVGPELAAVLGAHAPWLLWELFNLKSDAVSARIRSYESLVKQDNPGREHATPLEAAPVPAAPASGIFNFFEKPSGVEQPEVILQLAAWLRALGLEVDLKAEAVGAELLTPEQIRSKSHGPVEAGALFSQKLFGPTKDYECECGKYARMKHRGVVCEVCGVEVIQSKVRRERFAHLELSAPCSHPLLLNGPQLDVIAVLPADLRPQGSALNALYEAVLAAKTPVAVQRAVEKLFTALAATVDETWKSSVFSKPVDSSAIAQLTVDPSLSPGSCRVPRAILTELFRPMVYGQLEAKGFVTTIKSAKKMVESGKPEAMKAVEAVSGGYPLLLACEGRVVCRTPLPWDAPAIAVDAQTARMLAAQTVCVHLPVTTQGVLEALKLSDLSGPGGSAARGWLSEAKQSGSLMALVTRAVKTGERETVEDPVLRCALGRVPPSPPLAELSAWEEAYREVVNAVELTVPVSKSNQPPEPDAFSRPLDELELSVRTSNGLAKWGLVTVGDLCRRTEAELLKTDGFGRANLKEVKEILAEMGLSLGMS